MLRSLDLNTAAERSSVKGFTIQTVARLSPNDAVLPQVITICEMVERGIGVVSNMIELLDRILSFILTLHSLPVS